MLGRRSNQARFDADIKRRFNLSDRGPAEVITDRLSFQSLSGLSITHPLSNDTTLTRFRQKLQGKGLLERLFSTLNSKLDRLYLLVKKGSFIDATRVQAQRRSLSKVKNNAKKEQDSDAIQIQSSTNEEEENLSSRHDNERQEKNNTTKLTKNGEACFAKDPDGRWTVKLNQPY